MIDSHAHLTGDGVYEQIDPLLERAREAGIEAIVNICTTPLTLERGIALAARVPWVYNAASTTPHDADKHGPEVFDLMAKAARSGALVAVGETGLDYHYWADSKTAQIPLLRRYIELALETDLPIVIHCREAFSDLFATFDDYPSARVVLHCFTGTPAEALEVTRRGWMISFSGIATFKKSLEIQEAFEQAPLSQILIETDTPYLAPQPVRGKPNEPAYLRYTAELLAPLRGLTPEILARETANNARRFFAIGKKGLPR